MNENNFQETIIALVRAFGWHRSMQTPCGQSVSIAEAHALLDISRADGISQNDLTISLNLAKSTVSRLVSKMVKRGWVWRKQNQQDRRAYQLYLTEEGERVAKELAKARQEKMIGILAQIPESKCSNVLDSLDVLVAAILRGDSNEGRFD